mmetsp:Transcript_135660/g.247334  ORF Transcript_135660/g.247334 Transcript_135660/m.247334 type:complete len:335 (-) Transcript_135660:73-1077(-)
MLPSGGEGLPTVTGTLVPRVIWILWFDGWEQAPELHQRCLESWQLFNLGWEVRAISRKEIPGLLGDFMPRYEQLRTAMNPIERFGGFWIPPAAESDLLRLLLLAMYGGVWADSTMLCRRPLDDWLTEVAASGFFAFSPESLEEKEYIPVMSSFLAAQPSHKLMVAWLKRVIEHWSTPSIERQDRGFFWVHNIFGELVAESPTGDAEAVRAWREVPRVTGEYGKKGPHFFVPYKKKLGPFPTPELQVAIEQDLETPMWKLTNHEVKLNDVTRDSCYWVLLEETRRQARAHLTRSLGNGSSATGGSLGPALAMLSAATHATVLKKLLTPGNDVGCH